MLTAVNLLDYVWVSRWNLQLGIPDAYFAMGYEALQPFAKRANLLPIFILAAKLCPPRAQAAAPTSRLYLPYRDPRDGGTPACRGVDSGPELLA